MSPVSTGFAPRVPLRSTHGLRSGAASRLKSSAFLPAQTSATGCQAPDFTDVSKVGASGVQAEQGPPLPTPRVTGIWRALLGAAWLVFQVYIVFYPQAPLLQRPLHLTLALGLLLLWKPLDPGRIGSVLAPAIDLLLLAGVAGTVGYYLLSASRLTERIEGIDEIFPVDVAWGILLILLLLEGVRRAVGWSLLSVLIAFLIYGTAGSSFPGWLRFGGFELTEGIEILTMTVNGVLGITTSTSLQFVFYFVMFGAVYSAIGGGQLFIDIGLKLAGQHKGGSAKAAVIASSMMGSISGSAVANVATTGVFTIPLMKRSGYSASLAGAIEAISSTGGQLMPPIMGVAAFVVAEMLQVDYVEVALAGLIPALAFYFAVFLFVDLAARKSGIGVLSPDQLESSPIWPRLYLLLPPIALVSVLLSGYSATYSALVAMVCCVLVCYFKRETWMDARDWLRAIEEGTRQAAQVAVPIAAIGIIIAVAIQSNLALKFSSQLIEGSGGTLYGAMLLIIAGCIIMGMGLPTVAAYIIGAILFVPALLKLGIPEMSAHFFVMYYCVLSMVTPPVALASYTAAGIAGGGVMQTSYQAFRLSLVSFFIPFAFAFDTRLLAEGPLPWVLVACLSLMAGTGAWAVALVGYLNKPLNWLERGLFGGLSLALIFSPSATASWTWALAGLGVMVLWAWLSPPVFEKA